MENIIRLSAFLMLIVGTLGLLMNELLFDWGRLSTFVFAFLNIIGLMALAFSFWRGKEDV